MMEGLFSFTCTFCRPLFGALMSALMTVYSQTAHADCWARAGKAYAIDPLLLMAIAKVESNLYPKAINTNANGSQDIGLMQINSIHLPRFARKGISRRQLFDPCTSVMAGAEILAGFIQRHGYGWEAVGAYNAGSAYRRAALRRVYVDKVWAQYAYLIAERRRSRRLLRVL